MTSTRDMSTSGATDPYRALLERKAVRAPERGLSRVPDLSAALKPHQRHVVDFALRAGSSAAFLETGLGKTFVALEWGRVVVEHTGRPVLMLAPLAVGQQHAAEAERFGIKAKLCRSGDDVEVDAVNVLNYERLHLVDPNVFSGVILDESSIIKSFTGVTTRKLMAAFSQTRFRLACTATPAPNDHMELGQHSQFLGAMDSNEMLARWFIADQRNMGRYRLKRYAVESFWSWVASWARCISKPSDLGFDDGAYALPELVTHRHQLASDLSIDAQEGMLFRVPDVSATGYHKEKRLSANDRAAKVAELVAAEPAETWAVWCDTDYEADALQAAIPEAVEVRGSMSAEVKEERLVAFSRGQIRVLVTKPSIAGFGLNWQHCARVAFAGMSFSYESYYQAIRRFWRFGQVRPVHCHVVMSDVEAAIWTTVARKAGDHDQMKRQMVAAMARSIEQRSTKLDYAPTKSASLPSWLRSAA